MSSFTLSYAPSEIVGLIPEGLDGNGRNGPPGRGEKAPGVSMLIPGTARSRTGVGRCVPPQPAAE